ncbi:amidase family protein [soil metagenome]
MDSLSFSAARRALDAGETTVERLVRECLARIEARNGDLNAFLFTDRDGALEAARKLDARVSAGETLPPLAGMTVGVKDTICVLGMPTTCASRMLENYRPLFDATAVARLRDAGAIILGKLNCDEFAMGSSSETSYFGPVRNPINGEYVPGGSSGGSAAAVAAGMCHVALGSDTGGSIRQPAAFCGVVGLKPTYGRVSRFGLVAFASSFDTLGPLAHTISDIAAVMDVIAGPDQNDSTSAPVPVSERGFRSALTGGPEELIAGLRVGLPREYFGEGLDLSIRTAVEERAEALEAGGASVVEVSLPHTEYGIAAYYVLTTAEASSNLARYDGVRFGHRADDSEVRRSVAMERENAGSSEESVVERMYSQTRTEGFGTEVKRRIMLGTFVLSSGYYDAYYDRAQRVRTLIRQDFEHAFAKVDVLMSPASPTPPFLVGEKTEDPLAMYLSDVYTVSANLAGIPGLVIPTAHEHPTGLPIGLQLLAPHFSEAQLLAVGDALMQL